MNSSQQPSASEAVDYTGVLRRRWWVALGVLVICLVGAVGYLAVASKSYTATASVYVSPTGDTSSQSSSSSSKDTSVNLYTEATLVNSGQVTAIASKTLHSSLSDYQLSKTVHVTVPANSQVLDIACEAPTAAGAATCANEFASAYLQNRTANAKAAIDQELASLTGKVKALQKTISGLNNSISHLPSDSPTRISDQTAETSDSTQLTSLNQQVADLTNASTNVSGGYRSTTATAPGKPTSPDKTIVLAAGLIIGAILGLLVAFIWDRRDSRLHSASDVERLAGLPVLMNLPGRGFGRDISLPSPRSRTGRAFTELASDVAASLGEGSHVVLVTSATGGPAASYVAANLAATLARTHSEAVLVCANMRDSLAPGLFGLTGNGRGLAEVVAGRATVGEVAPGPAGVPGLWVIPPGADPSLVEYHLQHDTAKALTTQLRRDARYVILEAQATQDGADTFALAEFADAAVLTVEANHTRRAQIAECVKRLRRIRVSVLGAAVIPPISRQANPRPPQQSQTPLNAGSLTRTAGDEPPALSSTDTTRPHPADRPLSGH
jgi:capsular polysaccharide biosynthesis protein/Mrp family chromosome partitioning ATPase